MFKREQVSIEAVESYYQDHQDWDNLKHFLEFLRGLDWCKTGLYHELDDNDYFHKEGWRVVHFNEKVEEKWFPSLVWGHTWFGISDCIVN